MARGTELKKDITNKLLQVFPGSFLYNDGKEIRIRGNENGDEIQVKVTLTCAKDNVEPEDKNSFPAVVTTQHTQSDAAAQITQEEKDNVRRLMEALNL